MIAQLNQYDDQELKKFYDKIKLFTDAGEIKKVSKVLTEQQNSLNAINTYNNNILKLINSYQLSNVKSRNENILERVGSDRDAPSISIDSSNLVSSLQNLSKMVDALSDKIKITDLSGSSSRVSPTSSGGFSLGKTAAILGTLAAGGILLSNIKSRPDQTTDKLNRTTGAAIQKSEQRLETTKIEQQSFSNQFASFMASLLSGGIIGGALGAIGSAIGIGGGDYSNLKPAGDSAHAGQAMQFFMSQGWTKEQAAGIVGNLQAESGRDLNSNAVGDNGRAYGIGQWHADRQANFSTKAKLGNIIGSSFEDQLKFVQWELNNTESQAGKRLKSAKTPQEAAAIVDALYERSAGLARGQRISNAIALAGDDYSKTKPTKQSNLGTSNAPKGTIWKGKDDSGLITFVSKTNDPRTGGVKYETWTNQDSTHHPISEEQAKTQIRSRGLLSDNTTAEKSVTKTSGVSLNGSPRITGRFGEQRSDHIHKGTDYGVPIGTSVYSILDGVVLRAYRSSTYGNVIYIKHANGVETRYAHLSAFNVSEGQSVKKGQLIGRSGNTGKSEGAHLHFEVRINGIAMDSSQYGNPLSGTGGQIMQGGNQSRVRLAGESTKSAINKARTKRNAPTMIVRNHMITKTNNAPAFAMQRSQSTQIIRPTTEYYDYLV